MTTAGNNKPRKGGRNRSRKTDCGESEEQPPGLCKTCAVRTECKYPKPESGVWHCDEYQ